ncbi:MAG: DUF4411 family protein [Acidimicrobiia bacterium]|nr:DUF4411 family protein [Acidimicrobiia bacterium]MYJ14671.1 DUF4411 family protein [Acidimicrobiia bacterium]
MLDTSALIEFKRLLPIPEQWNAFVRLGSLVENGRIAMPRQVLAEATTVSHPDVPGAWAAAMRRRLRHTLDPDYHFVRLVMEAAGDVVDPNKTTDDADPYVVALALHTREQGFDVVVVTADVVDRPPRRISLATACARLNVEVANPTEFLVAAGIWPLRGDSATGDPMA